MIMTWKWNVKCRQGHGNILRVDLSLWASTLIVLRCPIPVIRRKNERNLEKMCAWSKRMFRKWFQLCLISFCTSYSNYPPIPPAPPSPCPQQSNHPLSVWLSTGLSRCEAILWSVCLLSGGERGGGGVQGGTEGDRTCAQREGWSYRQPLLRRGV